MKIFEKERDGRAEVTELTKEEFRRRFRPFRNMLNRRFLVLGTRLDPNEFYKTIPFRSTDAPWAYWEEYEEHFKQMNYIPTPYPYSVLEWLEKELKRQKLAEIKKINFDKMNKKFTYKVNKNGK